MNTAVFHSKSSGSCYRSSILDLPGEVTLPLGKHKRNKTLISVTNIGMSTYLCLLCMQGVKKKKWFKANWILTNILGKNIDLYLGKKG